MEPYVLDHVESYSGNTVDTYSPTRYGEVMTAEEAEALTEAGRRAAPPGWGSSFGRTDIIVVYDSDTETGFLKSPVSVFFVHRWEFIRYNGGM